MGIYRELWEFIGELWFISKTLLARNICCRCIGLAQGLPLLYQKDLEDLKDFSAKQTKKD
jgi:hypothetical protein